MYVNRDLEKKIESYLHTPEIIALLGARQVGKTTLLKNLFEKRPNCNFITFEDREILTMFQEDINSFSKLFLSKCDILIIDEFQYAREGGQKLKFLFDTVPNKKIIISGSSSLDLTKQATKFLVGRIFQFKLHPFSFYEFLSFRDEEGYQNVLKKLINQVKQTIASKKESLPELSSTIRIRFSRFVDEFIVFGGFPRASIAEDFEEKQIVLKNIFSTYLLKEIRDILNLSDDFEIEKLAKYLALKISNPIQMDELSNFIGVHIKKTRQLLNILEKTYIISLINPYFSNKLLEISKSKKIFFSDTGFRNSIIQNFQDIFLRPDKGALFENFVFSEITKGELEIKYWRTKSKAEVDFILEINSKIIPVEIKSNISKPTLQKSLVSFIKKYKPEIAFVFSSNYYDSRKFENTVIYFLPFFMIKVILELSETC